MVFLVSLVHFVYLVYLVYLVCLVWFLHLPLVTVLCHSTLDTRHFLIAVSCHTADEVRQAEAQGADFAVFGPVFEKVGTSIRVGLDALRAACSGHMPVLAVGGITLANASACREAGAAGIAAIRLFQQNDVFRVAEELRRIEATAIGNLP